MPVRPVDTVNALWSKMERIYCSRAGVIVTVLRWGTGIVWLAATGWWCFSAVYWQLQGGDVSVLCTGSYRLLMLQCYALAAIGCWCFSAVHWQLQDVDVSVLCTGSYRVLMFQYCALEATGCWCFSAVHWQLQGVDVTVLCTGSYIVLMFSVI